MENLVGNSLKERKATNKAKTKKKPMKVVYISNPMKFKISASEFRDLVQELTGQDSELPVDPSKYIMCTTDDHVGSGNQTVLDHASSKTDDDDNHHALEVRTGLDLSGKQQQPAQIQDYNDDSPWFASSPFDDYLTASMFETSYQQG